MVQGNAINDSLKWPIAVHGSHFGLVKQNVVFGGSQLTGAGIAIEDGTETENLFEENFVAYVRGSINPRESGPSTADGTTPGSAAECIWAAGFNNRFVNNVASSCRNPVQQIVSGPGFKFIVPAAPYTARNPRFRGADMTDPSQTVDVTPQHQPMLEFRRNEVYGLAADGLTFGPRHRWLQHHSVDDGGSLVKDFRVWHTYEGAIWNYPAHRMIADGLVYRVDPAATLYWPTAFQCGDYRNVDITIRGGSVHAGGVFGGCTDPLGPIASRTSMLSPGMRHSRSKRRRRQARAPTGRHGSDDGAAKQHRAAMAGPRVGDDPDEPHDGERNSQPNYRYYVFVDDYQGQAGDNFRVYFHPQATQNLYGGVAPAAIRRCGRKSTASRAR